jgi:hypothetical protein
MYIDFQGEITAQHDNNTTSNTRSTLVAIYDYQKTKKERKKYDEGNNKL